MRIGVPKEIKNNENRVGLTPDSVRELIAAGHEVIIEKGAGLGSEFTDEDYIRAATEAGSKASLKIVDTAKEVFDAAEMIVKVKEPQEQEIKMMHKGQTLFTYLHLAPDPEQALGLMRQGVTAIAYETVTDIKGKLPLLRPMSEVAGKYSATLGADLLAKHNKGRGILLAGVTGVNPANVVVLGGGVSGTAAAGQAAAMGANVTIIEYDEKRRAELAKEFGQYKNVTILPSNPTTIESSVVRADLVIGTVLVPGEGAPKLINKELLGKMKKGSVIVDISIDQGGCVEGVEATTHDNPTRTVGNGVIVYSVANMPGAFPWTASQALNAATLPFVKEIADKGVFQALFDNEHLRNGLNVAGGKIVHHGVEKALRALARAERIVGLRYSTARQALEKLGIAARASARSQPASQNRAKPA